MAKAFPGIGRLGDFLQGPIKVDKPSLNEGAARSLSGTNHIRSRRNNGGTGMNMVSIFRGAKFAAFVVAALAIAGCAKQQAEQTGLVGGAAAPGSQQDFVVNVGDRVFFETDSSELTEQARATLDKQAQWLGNYNHYAFTIEGHADERGTREYNIALGARRAQTVREYLVSRGITAQRMHTISYGKERPVAVCNDISCWSQNRRAVTVLNQSS